MEPEVTDNSDFDAVDGQSTERLQRSALPGDSGGHLTSRSPAIPRSFGGDDYLTLSLYLRHHAFQQLVERLDRHRQAAEERQQDGDRLLLAGQEFQVMPSGAKAGSKSSRAYFRWQLQSATGYSLQLMKRESCEGSTPNAKLVAASLVLKRLGPEEVVRLAYLAIRALGAEVASDKVSRVDVCCDLPGRKLAAMKAAFDAGHYVVRAPSSDEHGTATQAVTSDFSVYQMSREATSFNVGRGHVRMRIYEKVKECRHDLVKLITMVQHRWGEFPLCAIRVEFQLRREKLKKLGVDTFADWLAKRASVVHYLTHEWFRMTDGPYDPDHADRTPILPEWCEVQDAFASWTGAGPLLELEPIPTQPVPPDLYIKSIIGLFVSLFAKLGVSIDNNETFWNESLYRLLDEIERRDMRAEVERRILELGVANPSNEKGESDE